MKVFEFLSAASPNEAYFQFYAKFECKSSTLRYAIFGKYIKKELIAWYITFFDVGLCFIFLLSLWIIQYLLRIDNDKYTYNSYEVCEFSVEITNLPDIDEETYPLTTLRSELRAKLQ